MRRVQGAGADRGHAIACPRVIERLGVVVVSLGVIAPVRVIPADLSEWRY